MYLKQDFDVPSFGITTPDGWACKFCGKDHPVWRDDCDCPQADQARHRHRQKHSKPALRIVAKNEEKENVEK